jgi:tetratricopeptide (TPR) repeat protein
MLSRNSIAPMVVFALLWMIPVRSQCGEAADGKIKNGQLLIEKALNSSGEQKADYIYKAKREFERASLAEPENPWPLYWNSVLSFYLEQDSANAAKLYRKALKFDTEVLANYPPPWLYKADANVKSAIKGNFKWVNESPTPIESPAIAKADTTKNLPPVVAVNPLDSLRGLIDSKNYGKADSLYGDLLSKAEYDTSNSLRLLGLELKLNEGLDAQCSDLLEEILGKSKKGSITQKTALGHYDKSLEAILAEARSLESRGRYPEAITILEKMEPYRLIPASAARGDLILRYASLLLATNNPESADSLLQLYLSAGYRKNATYSNVNSRLTIVKKQNKETTEPKLTQTARKIEAKSQAKPEQYITLVPPGGDVMKVLVSSIDPISGQIQDNSLWETTGPLKLKTGTAYKLSVQRKHERKASLFIAAAGIIATFFIVR